MSFSVQDPGRVGQSTYWMYFGGNIVLGALLLIGGLYSIFTGSFVTGIVMMLLLLPMGIYFRVIMMRRCRDIGWPAFLPWLPFIAMIAIGGSMGLGGVPSALAASPSLALRSLGLVNFISLADFIFMIVIGCIGSKGYYGSPGGGYGDPATANYAPVDYGNAASAAPARVPEIVYPDTRDSMSGEPDLDRWDAAIAQRLAALSAAQDDGAPQEAQPSAAPVSAPASVRPAAPTPGPMVQRPATGFGRKVA